MNQPTDEQIAKVADSIYRNIVKNPDVMHIAVSDCLDDVPMLGEMLCRDMVCSAGIALHEAALKVIRAYASDIAERWFYDNYGAYDRHWLADWEPYKHRMVGTKAEWLDRLP